MKQVKIYKTPTCPYCQNAENFLNDKNIPFESIDLSKDPDLMEQIMNQTKMRTVPQIFIGDHFVGGFSELSALPKEELKKLLGE